ncbi:right-handed parallel beta-helix repeat-containing protein [Yoonia sp. BS5-3]|uniref:Right-handed parallel beta-helix repeat-containing protein n=1 Tax=Yoonia phaeophyticola TaxID=3137369 RepID=A0ABZ3IDX2_9RHOB
MLNRCHHMLWAGCMAVCTALPQGAAAQRDMQSYAALQAQLTDLDAALTDVAGTILSVSDLPETATQVIPGENAAMRPAMDAQQMAPASITMVDLRVALLQLAFAVGGNDQIPLVRAQNTQAPQVIGIRGGSVDLATLQEWAAEQPGAIFDGDTLRRPIIIFQDGRLALKAGDQLTLSREDGAFVVNLGKLTAQNAMILGTAEASPGDDSFAPFVTTVGTGMAQVSDSLIENLGFGSTIAFSGFSVVNRGLYAPVGTSFLTDSVLRDVGVVGFDSTEDTVIAGNLFTGGDAGGLELRGVERVQVSENIFAANEDGSALLVTDGSTGGTIASNTILSSAGTGIIVNKGSDNTVITHNVIWNAAGSGVTIADSDCGYLDANIAIENRRKGIELRSSQRSAVVDNSLMGNRSAGLFISDQPQGTETTVRGNAFIGNRIGLSSASADHVQLYGNDFTNQFPRFLDGDFASDSLAIMADLRGQQSLTLTATGIASFTGAPATCTYKLEG